MLVLFFFKTNSLHLDRLQGISVSTWPAKVLRNYITSTISSGLIYNNLHRSIIGIFTKRLRGVSGQFTRSRSLVCFWRQLTYNGTKENQLSVKCFFLGMNSVCFWRQLTYKGTKQNQLSANCGKLVRSSYELSIPHLHFLYILSYKDPGLICTRKQSW